MREFDPAVMALGVMLYIFASVVSSALGWRIIVGKLDPLLWTLPAALFLAGVAVMLCFGQTSLI